MQPSYRYSAKVTRIIDGDTIEALVDLGFSIFTSVRFRLHGLDTPEKNSPDIQTQILANNATNFVASAILNETVTIESVKKDKYGRWLAKVFMKPGVFNKNEQPSLNEQLISLGYAKAYFGDHK